MIHDVMLSQLVRPREHDRVLRLPSSLGRVDRAILEAALGEWRGGTWAEALARLLEATERAIPAGRIYVLGHAARGPVVGSLVSGVGITPDRGGISIVKVMPGDARLVALARIAR